MISQKGVLYDWTPLCETAFRSLKQALISAPCLVLPNTGPEARFVLATDSSGFAIGSVLLQDQGRGLQPVEYYARNMIHTECKYPVHEQELLAIVRSIQHLRHYLEGCAHFLVVTDHSTIKHFMTQPQASRRQAGWIEILSPYANNMDIFYKKGVENMADGLSRRPDLKRYVEQWEEYELNSDNAKLEELYMP